jgi:hypothetical protein
MPVCDNVGISMIAGNTADTLDVFFAWALDNFTEVNVVAQPDNYDDTVDVCQHYANAHDDVINLKIHEFENFSAQFQRAIDMCSKPWCIQLGADEILADFPYEKIPDLMARMGKKVGILPRYNLQRDWQHYNREGYPDWQRRVIDVHSDVKMNGAEVDETLCVDPADCAIIESLPIIHFGHIRPHEALIQKGKDRIKFADADPCDGPKLKEHGIEWFEKRNIAWDLAARPVPSLMVKWIDLYLPNDDPMRGA